MLDEQMTKIYSALNRFTESYEEVVRIQRENMQSIVDLARYCQHLELLLNNQKYELKDPNVDYFRPTFRSNEETVRLIVEEKKSLARFGDGELAIAFHIPRQKFQRVDEKLAERIWEVLNTDTPENLLLAVADHYGSLDRFNEQAAEGIRLYMTEETRRQHEQIIPANRVYSDTYVTRPYVIYRDVFTEAPRQRFEMLKTIWKGKRIIVVEGAQTRLGVGNDLLSGAGEIRRILAPATNSFDRYEEIYQECLEQGDSADLFLLAIGPSSGILAYDLALCSYQAVDVGHIDMEYEWFLAGRGERVSVPYKYNNEVEGGDRVEELHDPVYESQIICSFA